MKSTNIFIVVVTCLLALSGGFVQATSVQTHIESSATTGGNEISEGQVLNGEARAYSSVKTIINGEEVVDIEKEQRGEGSAQSYIEIDANADANSATVSSTSSKSFDAATGSNASQADEAGTVETDEVAAEGSAERSASLSVMWASITLLFDRVEKFIISIFT